MLSPTAKAIGSPSEQYALACCGTIDMTLILCEYLTPLFKLHGLEFSTLYGMVFFIENYYKRNKMYKVFLDGLEIATTKLEGGDPPMGVASGVLNFKDKNFGYKEIKEYCEKNNIETSTDEPEDKVICTM